MTIRRRLQIALTFGYMLASSDAFAQAPCAVEVIVEPTRPHVGQQILYRARIFRREDVDRVEWVQPPAFPDLRSEWLPGRAEDTRVTLDGASYRVREDQRALFAALPGRTQLPHFELRCADRTIPVPGPTLDVRETPAHGRPPGHSRLVGPLVVQATADRDEVTLGQSVRVSILVRGDSNLWDLEAPFQNIDAKHFEIFRHRPELDLEAGERLYVRRYFRFDFVPREPGRLEIPAVRVPYFDTRTGRYAIAQTEPIEIAVGPRRVSNATPEPLTSPSDLPDVPQQADRSLAVPLVGLLVLASGVAGFRLARKHRADRAEVDDALRRATECGQRRDLAGQAAALTRALSRAVALAGARRLEALAAEIVSQRRRLEEMRFAERPDEPQQEAVESLIRQLRGWR